MSQADLQQLTWGYPGILWAEQSESIDNCQLNLLSLGNSLLPAPVIPSTLTQSELQGLTWGYGCLLWDEYSPPVIPSKVGGDDRIHPGWSKKAWKRRRQAELRLEQTIKETYENLMGIPPPEAVVQELVQAAVQEIESVSWRQEAASIEWLDIQSKRIDQFIREQQEFDDEEALLALM